MQSTQEELKISDSSKPKKDLPLHSLNKLNPKDMRFLQKLGAGGFGTVRLAKLKVDPSETKTETWFKADKVEDYST